MEGVNLLPQSETEDAKWRGLRRKVVATTTVVLVVYLVATAAVFGWWWYVRGRQADLSDAAVDLQRRVSSLAPVEAWWRLAADRAGGIAEVVDSRPDVASQAGRLSSQLGVTIVGWVSQAGKPQTVSVVAPTAAAVEDYAQALTGFYRRVGLTTLTSDDGGITWEATLTLDL